MVASRAMRIARELYDEVERFREFLDTISADDFAGSEGGESHPEGS